MQKSSVVGINVNRRPVDENELARGEDDHVDGRLLEEEEMTVICRIGSEVKLKMKDMQCR